MRQCPVFPGSGLERRRDRRSPATLESRRQALVGRAERGLADRSPEDGGALPPLASFSDNSSDIVVGGSRVTVISAPSRASQNGDSGCFTVTAAEPFGLSLNDHDMSLPACCESRSFDAGAVVSVEASTLSWLQSSSKSLRSASSASGAAASVADVSGFSPGGTFCAPAGSTD